MTQAFPVRMMSFFADGKPLSRYWFRDNAYLTHRASALTLLFPRGEQFFVRAVRDVAHLVKDPELQRNITAFCAQEGQHGRAHTAHFELLRALRLDIETPLAALEKRTSWAERNVRPRMRLAITAASEHLTAVLARAVLGTERDFCAGVDPRVRSLFRWHALEELEHKAVAFDVLKAIRTPYSIRAAGALFAFASIMARWQTITRHLCQQDGMSAHQIEQGRIEANATNDLSPIALARQFAPYFDPAFHPNNEDDTSLIQRTRDEFSHAVVGRTLVNPASITLITSPQACDADAAGYPKRHEHHRSVEKMLRSVVCRGESREETKKEIR